MGLGMIVSQYVRCQRKGIRLIAAGMSPRVLELFKMTKVDTIIPMIATIEEADAH
jgi:anti-anti-sigma factor